jgi:hypothetical protein
VAEPIEETFGGSKFHRTGDDDHAPTVSQQHARFTTLAAAEYSRATATDNGGSQQSSWQ